MKEPTLVIQKIGYLAAMPLNNMALYALLGRVLKDAREEAGATHHDVMNAGGTDPSSQSRLENGHLTEPPKKFDQVLIGYSAVSGRSVVALMRLWTEAIEGELQQLELARDQPE